MVYVEPGPAGEGAGLWRAWHDRFGEGEDHPDFAPLMTFWLRWQDSAMVGYADCERLTAIFKARGWFRMIVTEQVGGALCWSFGVVQKHGEELRWVDGWSRLRAEELPAIEERILAELAADGLIGPGDGLVTD